uniref:Uncharacterized protein n=1 Tax=Phenylobacterium glaciei TaxID=2803784 RepID=A0A974P293_9CAUL|nr:hypothetical protein JKL49_20695 [Phenylobacterium glaciei]
MLTVKAGRGTPPALGRGDLLIIPGLGTRSEDELIAGLATPAVRRAARIAALSHTAGACVAASCASTFILGRRACSRVGGRRPPGGWRRCSAGCTRMWIWSPTRSWWPTGRSPRRARPWRRWT